MKLKSFINYNVDIQKQEQIDESLNDKDFTISAEEKKVTQDLFQIKKW